jgi:Flp pilus assembly protein TadD
VAAVLLFVALLGGAAGLWWVQKRAAAEAEARALLDEGHRLEREGKWPEALNAVRHAQGILASAGPDWDLHRQAKELNKDLGMARRLEEAWLRSATPRLIVNGVGDAGYPDAFQWYGLNLTALTPEEAAGRVRASAISLRLVAALDDWAILQSWGVWGFRVAGTRQAEVASRADDDPWRQRLREAARRLDRAALKELAVHEGARSQPTTHLVLLARSLRLAGCQSEAEPLLRRAQQEHATDFWLNHELGIALLGQGVDPHEKALDPAEAARFLQAALALRPKSARSWLALGIALAHQKKWVEAESAYHKGIELDFELAQRYRVFGLSLCDFPNRPAEAEAAFRKAIDLTPGDPELYYYLGNILDEQQKEQEAAAAYRKAIALRPQDYRPYCNLGAVLCDFLHRPAEAEASFRKAIDLQPGDYELYVNLGIALRKQNKLTESLAAFRKADEFPNNPDNHPDKHAYLRLAERLIELDKRWPSTLTGEAKPGSPQERIELALLCFYCREQYAAAAHLYADAFKADSEFENDQHRYEATCAAALASCGQGKDADKLSDQERAGLRQQALAWLQADLAALKWQRKNGRDADGAALSERMQEWRAGPDFVGVRGGAIEKLPEAERVGWRKLWAEVAATQRRP